MKKSIPLLLALFGIIDAGYLTYEHYAKLIVPCRIALFADCGKVLNSPYATPFGVPLALLGLIHYTALLIVAICAWRYKSRLWSSLLLAQTCLGLIASLYFMYLQLFVIQALCLYCTASALNSLLAFIAVRIIYPNEYRRWIITLSSWFYRYVVKNIFFLLPPEIIHSIMTRSGEAMGTIPFIKAIASWCFSQPFPALTQTVHGISFRSPVGLSAGFDYEARLTQILLSLGFGFQSIGTITNTAYEGNPRPRLGRLPKSRSLMVNKGFKNDGAKAVVKKLRRLSFAIPVGISIGRTNTARITTVQEAIDDIVNAFLQFEQSSVHHAYYELNISCPNLYGTVSFYPSTHLEALLKAIDKLHLQRPVFVKMPIEKTDKEFLALLKVIIKHKIAGIIVGNLQKDKTDPAFDNDEVKRWSVGGFSGKPTERRSNELIALAYKTYGKKLTIIGCGGIFSGEDAYEKIKRGATLVQLITGMIYTGPQLIAQINAELAILLKRDGYTSITQARGNAD